MHTGAAAVACRGRAEAFRRSNDSVKINISWLDFSPPLLTSTGAAAVAHRGRAEAVRQDVLRGGRQR